MLVTPWGFRDILPDEAQLREDIAGTVRACLKNLGYRPVETPLIEDQGAYEAGGRAADTPFKLFDDDGRLLVVRPDNTPSIARVVSARMGGAELPLRLRYEAPVVRGGARYAGGSRQFTQLGFELIGADAPAGDIEVVRAVVACLRALGAPSWRIVCGSVRPLAALTAAVADRALARDVLALVHANDLVGLDACVDQAALDPALARALRELPRLTGGAEVLDRADALLDRAGCGAGATADLRALAGALGADASALAFDFSILNSFDYYTGIVFKAYAGGLADPVGSGGRYDATLARTRGADAHTPAAGFAFSLERLEGACQAGAETPLPAVETGVTRPAEGPLRIAVPKGSLNPGTIEALAAAGLDTSSLRDPGRRLIVPGRDLDPAGGIGAIEYIIVRATDAPAFVACGGADCGFCGSDALIEADRDLLQLVDLRYGACRFIEAEPKGRADRTARAYARRGSLRVATKYPRIAAAWYAQRGVAADIITLHGNIELGPIVGLSDRIVDITATGTTLKQNNLVITGEIMTCTARFFANPGRAHLDPRVRMLGDRLAASVCR